MATAPIAAPRTARSARGAARQSQEAEGDLHVVVVHPPGVELHVEHEVQHHGDGRRQHRHRRQAGRPTRLAGQLAGGQERRQRGGEDPEQRPGGARHQLGLPLTGAGQRNSLVGEGQAPVDQSRPVHPHAHGRLQAHDVLVVPAPPVQEVAHQHEPHGVVGVAEADEDPRVVAHAEHQGDDQGREQRRGAPAAATGPGPAAAAGRSWPDPCGGWLRRARGRRSAALRRPLDAEDLHRLLQELPGGVAVLAGALRRPLVDGADHGPCRKPRGRTRRNLARPDCACCHSRAPGCPRGR